MQVNAFRIVMLSIDIFAMSLILGATAWFFFIQSPVLYKVMGQEQFVPVQMRLARTLFSTVLVALIVLMITVVLHAESLLSLPTLAAASALALGVVIKFVIFPRALRAGGESHRLHEDRGETGTASEFVSVGAGHSATEMHRVVVLFVVLMVAGLVTHGIGLVASM